MRYGDGWKRLALKYKDMMKFALVLLLTPTAGLAQSTFSAGSPYAYVANAGWLNFLPNATVGAVVTETYLTGYAYGANFGWVRLGYVRPDNYHTYSNLISTDFGVNVSATGLLTGYAYGANIGWINFEQTHGKPRIDPFTGIFTGFAYSANLGWISLDTPMSNLITSTITAPDSDGDGISTAWEFEKFGGVGTATATSDFDKDGISDFQEYLAATDPKNAADSFKITSISHASGTTTTTLTFTSKPSRLYRVERDTDLVGIWTDSGFGNFAAAAGVTTTKSITHPAGLKLFFRASAIRPLQP